ncbi:YfiT family bacillithiol transferase [Ferruginibacter yonginensis]|uniref:YfiT family bacillithiol transferase n=1 Tax=Ferruginibacter yonginensis TaxID=1310416 RepID=A0ABV8QN84_9BACT
MDNDLSFPIGKYIEQPFSQQQLEEWLIDIEVLPKAIEYAITNLDEAQLNTAYRPNGWTIIQVVHHVADSHMNAFIRFKLGLTEDNPTIKPYDQNAWALLNDVQTIPINVSITMLYAIHVRMVAVLKSITTEQWQRTVVHPEYNKQMTLWYLLGNYAWHGKHHTAHINKLRDRMGW